MPKDKIPSRRTFREAIVSLKLPRDAHFVCRLTFARPGASILPIRSLRSPCLKEETMPNYLIQVAYNSEAWQALIKNPQDRIEAVRPAVENLGGKIKEGWFAFGEYDAVLIAELPDNVAASAIAIAFAAGGACKSVKTTPLMSSAEAVEALKKASRAGYRAATA